MPALNPHREKPIDLVGIGVSVWDCILLVDLFPQEGSVSQARQRCEGIGGGVAVAIATAARLGSRTAMIDSLGDDAAARSILQTFNDAGVDTTQTRRLPGHTTSIASIWAESKTAERTIVFSPGSACTELEWNSGIEKLVADAKVLHLNGRHPKICRSAIEVAKANGTRVSFDGGAHRYRPEIIPLLEQSEIVVVAKHFAECHCHSRGISTNAKRLDELADRMLDDLGCQITGVTDGARGSYFVSQDGNRVSQAAVHPELAIDTTGCGDTFHGAFLHALTETENLEQAGRLAAEIASRNARALGALAF